MAYYDPEFPNVAYHCGALVAIYADIQHTAMPDVKAGIVQRFYASASRTPGLVLGRLAEMSQHHLEKIENDWLVKTYEERLNQATMFFGKDSEHALPITLNLEQQSYFAIGYRQMCAKINADKQAAAAKRKNKEQNKAETMQEE